MRRAASIGLALAVFMAAPQLAALADEDVQILFVAPFLDGPEPIRNEASFSVPQPIVFLDPLTFGDPAEHPGETVLQRQGPDEFKVRLSGTVYDFIADIVPEGRANIREVRLQGTPGVPHAVVPVRALPPSEQEAVPPNEFLEQMAKMPPSFGPVRPFAFAGRFESEIMTLRVQSGYSGIYAEAVNVNGKSGFSKLDVNATVNREEHRYDIEAEIEHQTDPGLVNIVLVYIRDASVNERNLGQAVATINGTKVGLKIVDGRLQLDRPLMGISGVPPEGIANLVQVTGTPDHFVIGYKGVRETFRWSYTR
jgi:hypothetical protein